MHAVSTILLLASLGTGSLSINLESSFHGIFFTSSDSDCLLLGPPIVPTDEAKGQFSDSVAAVRSQLHDCELFFREEVDGEIEEEPVLVIPVGDRECHELPATGLHWNVICDGDDEKDE